MTGHGASAPTVSVIVPAKNEAGYVRETLASIADQDTDRAVECLVVDGQSTDQTAAIAREFGVRVIEGDGSGIAHGRNLGAAHASGEWLAFVDADTTVAEGYVDTMLDFLDREGLEAGSSYCRVSGPRRATVMEATINHVFPRLRLPILPGFNFVVDATVFDSVGGFPEVPNEDTAFSRHLARNYATGYCPRVLVETSGRRIARSGLTGTLYHYLSLDWHRIRTPSYSTA
jgi:glycosyltransferase involved in cell wall biosynthesis